MATANPCRSALESALGRTLGDQEFKKIESDFKIASKDAAKAFGKGFSSQPANVRAKLISDQLNLNRAKSLTAIENQLLANANITSLTNLASTLGKDINTISADELADNINNMISDTFLGRKAYIDRGGNTKSFESVMKTISNRLGMVWFGKDGIRHNKFKEAYSLGGTRINRQVEDALMEDILNKGYLDDLFLAMNDEYAKVGLKTKVTKLDIPIKRDDIVTLYMNKGKDRDLAAREFEAFTQPLLKNSSVDLKAIYISMLDNVDMLDGSGVNRNGASLFNDLEFKDGASYMSFVRMFGKDKNLVSHVANTIDGVAADVSKQVNFKGEDVLRTIDDKLNSMSAVEDRTKLERTRITYETLVQGRGRSYNTNLMDLTLDFTKSLTSVLLLTRTAIKGFVTDKINTMTILSGRGNFGGAGNYLADSLAGLTGKEIDSFYYGYDELMLGMNHYLNTSTSSVLSTNLWRRGLERGNRFLKNLASTVQAVQGQNIQVRANKRSAGKIAERELFDATYNPELRNSIDPAIHAIGQKLGLKSLSDLYALQKVDYDTKLGKSTTDAEFAQAKNDLTLDFEAAIMHQIHSVQIDSGGVGVQAQNIRLFGDPNSGYYRYGLKVIGQFASYGQNFLLKSGLVQGILNANTISGRVKWSSLYLAAAIMGGYSNYNVGEILKNKQDAELADPISDLIDVFNGDSDASKRFWSNLLAGSSIPYSKQFETTVTGGKASSLAPTPSYVIGVSGSFIDLVQDPLDPQTQVDFSRKILPFNLPVAYEALEFIRNQYAGEE